MWRAAGTAVRMSKTASNSYSIVKAPEMDHHGPFDSAAEVTEFVRGYVAEHGERDARTNLAVYAVHEEHGPRHTVPLDRFLEGPTPPGLDLAT
jgi:hypothetical protein